MINKVYICYIYFVIVIDDWVKFVGCLILIVVCFCMINVVYFEGFIKVFLVNIGFFF